MSTKQAVNGIDVAALESVAAAVVADASQGDAGFEVHTQWLGGTRSRGEAKTMSLGGQAVDRGFTIDADEPHELLGTDLAANPQELLLAALNACMTVGYVANAAARGIKLDSLQIRSRGRLDLRGFLDLDPAVPPSYETVEVEVLLRSPANPEALEALHKHVLKTSPNFNNFARPIVMKATLHKQSA